jgi:hypothetical protein
MAEAASGGGVQDDGLGAVSGDGRVMWFDRAANSPGAPGEQLNCEFSSSTGTISGEPTASL